MTDIYSIPNNVIGDGATDNTTALQGWINTLASTNTIGYLPSGVYVSGTLIIPSNVTIVGSGMYTTTIKAKNSLNANLMVNSNGGTTNPQAGNSNIKFSNFTIDGNGQTQTAPSYVLGFQYVNNLELDHINMINPYSTLLWTSQSDNLGSGPNGRLATPYGQFFNANVHIHDCIFNGVGQVETNADLNVIGSVQNPKIERNVFIGGGANCLSYQFGNGGVIRDNQFTTFSSGLYVESSFKTSICNNSFYGAGVRSSQTPGAWYRGVWLASANESYGASAGYACSSDNLIDGNKFHDFAVSDPANPLVAIRMSGLPGNLSSNNNIIVNNRITNWWNWASSTPTTWHILLEGQCNYCQVSHNICDGNGTSQGIGVYLGGNAYMGTSQTINCSAHSNILSNMNTAIYQQGNTSVGTSIIGNSVNGCRQPVVVTNSGQPNSTIALNV